MSLSECAWCGGHIPLGPDASNCCVKCGKHVMSAPPSATQSDHESRLVRELQRRIHDLNATLEHAAKTLTLMKAVLDGHGLHTAGIGAAMAAEACRLAASVELPT